MVDSQVDVYIILEGYISEYSNRPDGMGFGEVHAGAILEAEEVILEMGDFHCNLDTNQVFWYYLDNYI